MRYKAQVRSSRRVAQAVRFGRMTHAGPVCGARRPNSRPHRTSLPADRGDANQSRAAVRPGGAGRAAAAAPHPRRNRTTLCMDRARSELACAWRSAPRRTRRPRDVNRYCGSPARPLRPIHRQNLDLICSAYFSQRRDWAEMILRRLSLDTSSTWRRRLAGDF